MDWLILFFDIMFALIATILGILGLSTLRAIRHLGTGKSFWMPIIVASALFLVGSIITILHEVNFSLTDRTVEVVQVSQLLALGFLFGGVFKYSRKVKKNLGEKLTVPENVKGNPETETPVALPVVHANSPVQERMIHENPKPVATSGCKHQFTYLRTLPRNASIPDECLSCNKIVECKHSSIGTSESRTLPPNA